MGKRKIIIKESVARSIAEIAWFIESKGMIKTAQKFSDAAYDFFETLTDDRKVYAPCRDEKRKIIGLKCLSYKKKYIIVFLETDFEIIVSEFIPSKLIY